MIRSKWKEIPGFGEHQLGKVAEDVRRSNRFSGQSDKLLGRQEGLEFSASQVAKTAIDAAVTAGNLGDIEAIAKAISEDEKQQIVYAYLAGSAVERMTDFMRGTGYGCLEKLGVVTVLQPGPRMQKYLGGGPFDSQTDGLQLEVTQIVKGTISGFRSQPSVGGVLSLDSMLGTTHIYGLVNPTTAEPQVSLGIYSD